MEFADHDQNIFENLPLMIWIFPDIPPARPEDPDRMEIARGLSHPYLLTGRDAAPKIRM